MSRKCEAPGCKNPKDNITVNMYYGKYAICANCLTKAIEFYVNK